jgi:hypothetical protein
MLSMRHPPRTQVAQAASEQRAVQGKTSDLCLAAAEYRATRRRSVFLGSIWLGSVWTPANSHWVRWVMQVTDGYNVPLLPEPR